MRLVALLVVVAACGRFGFIERDLGDASDADAPVDSACALGPWGSPQLLAEVSTTDDEFDASLSSDGLTLYFSSILGGPRDIWISTRASIGATWAAAMKVPELSTAMDEEGNPEISPDGLEMYFGLGSVFRKTRATTADPFTNQQEILPSTAQYTGTIGAQLSSDGLDMYFAASPTVGSARKQMYRTRRATITSAFTTAGMLPVTDPAKENAFMALSPDGLELVFSRDQGGPSWDMFQLTRASTSVEFDASTEEALPINTSSSDADPEISSTGREIIFNSDRPGGIGGYDLYVATRGCL